VAEFLDVMLAAGSLIGRWGFENGTPIFRSTDVKESGVAISTSIATFTVGAVTESSDFGMISQIPRPLWSYALFFATSRMRLFILSIVRYLIPQGKNKPG